VVRLVLLLGLAAGAVAGAVGCVRRRLIVVTVAGHSMEPTVHHGDRVLVRRCHPRGLRCGDVVVLDPPDTRLRVGGIWREPVTGRQVKRVAALPGQPVPIGVASPSSVVPVDTVVVLSDNAVVGVDSRVWGPYPARGVVGVVLRRVATSRRR
jgi:signal peptidase I